MQIGASMTDQTNDPIVLAEVRLLRQLLESKAERPYTDVAGYAARLDMSQRTVRTWLTQGLPHIYCGRSVRIPVQAADAWLAKRGKQPANATTKHMSHRRGAPQVDKP
jgi:hypothetical protein